MSFDFLYIKSHRARLGVLGVTDFFLAQRGSMHGGWERLNSMNCNYDWTKMVFQLFSTVYITRPRRLCFKKFNFFFSG